MSRIRPFTPGDEPNLAKVCLRTAAAGKDATGLLEDDDLWAELFVLPYVAHDPEYAFVVETDAGQAAGYIVATADTDAFEQWFHDSWWPRFTDRWPQPDGELAQQDGLLHYAYSRRGGITPYTAKYPAHLHIDLLPELQGQGWGPRLIDALLERLRAAGVPGLHLVAVAANTGALGFYEHLGFTALPSEPGLQAFGIEL